MYALQWDMDHQNQTGENFFEVFKGREEILFHSHLSSCRALFSTSWRGCNWERGLWRPEAQHHPTRVPCPQRVHVASVRRGPGSGAAIWISKHDHTHRRGVGSLWILKHNFKTRKATNANLNSMTLTVLPSLGFFCPQPMYRKRGLITTLYLN